MAMLVSLTSFAAALGEGYSKVTDITTLSAGDKVVLCCDDADKGVTGWDGTKTATAAAEGWVEYVVETAEGGVLLKDGEQYIALTAKNGFYYTATGSVCKVTADGVLYITLNDVDYLLYENANNGSPLYRMYVDKTGNAQYKPVYVYEVVVAEEGGESEGEGETATVPTNAELWEAFKPYYNTYYGLARADQPIDKVTTFAPAKMQEIMTDAKSDYKWLGDYVLNVAAGQGLNLPTDMAAANEGAWRWAVHAFFNATTGANGAAGTDFTEAGKPENWGPYYLAAQEGTTPEPEPTTETVYFVNAANWTTVNVYAWTTDPIVAWPGTAATKEAEQIGGFDVYSYTLEAGAAANVIFNNGAGQQTTDLVWTAGKYYVKDGWYTKEEAEAKLAAPTPEPTDTWTVAGSLIFGSNWTPSDVTNDMTLQADGTYKWEKAELELAAGAKIEFKVVKNHAWGEEYPSQNYVINISESGIYTITITFNAETKEVAAVATKTAGSEIVVNYEYVLMGVKGDWTTGIAMTVNPDNANEYVLLQQEILEGDAVKVVTLTDGTATAYCGNVDEWSVEHEFDADGNIVLAPGKYDFYYKVTEDLIYIGGEAYPTEPEYALEETVEISNLTTETLTVGEATYLQLTGRNDMLDSDVQLFLNNYTGEDKEYEVNAENSLMTFGGIELTVVEGKIAQATDPEKGKVYTGRVIASAEEEGEVMLVALDLVMFSTPAVDVEIENATARVDEETGSLVLNAEWTKDGVTYPVFVYVAGYEDVEFKEYEGAQISELQIGDDDNWLDFAVANVVAVIKDGQNISIEGEYTSWATGTTYALTISGQLPKVEEPDPVKPEPTYTDNNLNPYAFGLESELSDDKSTLTMTYRLNNSKATDVDVVVKGGDEVIIIVNGTTNIGKNTVEISTEGFPGGVDITWSVIVKGTSVEAPTCEEKIYSFYHPSGVDIDINPENPTFGMLLVNEGMQKVKGVDGYVSSGFGSGIYAFTPSFDLIPNGDQPGYNGGIEFTEGRADNSAKTAYAPRRIRISEDGRIFVTSLNTDGNYLWEVNAADMNKWTPVFNGASTSDQAELLDAEGNFIAAPNAGFDVKGTGENLQLAMYSATISGIDAFAMSGFRLHEYNLGTATEWTTAPSKAIVEGLYAINYTGTQVEYDNEGGLWIASYRGTASDANPGLVHINAEGVEDAKLVWNNVRQAGIRFNKDFTKLVVAGNNGAAKKATIYTISKDANGAPVLTQEAVVDMAVVGNNLNDFAWDYAGNLYACGNSSEKLAAWAMPYSGEVETPAASKYAFQLEGTGSDYEMYEDVITNLVIDYDNLLLIGGPSEAFQVEVVLGLGDYDRNTDAYQLLPASTISVLGSEAQFIDGYASVDGIEQSATAVVHCTWNGMALEFHLTMTAAPLEATKVVVENAAIEIEKYLLWGDMYDYSLKMTGVWHNEEDGLDYPVTVEVPVYYPDATEPYEIYSTVTVGGMGDEDPWLGFGEGYLTITPEGKKITATGIAENSWVGIAIDITISGTIIETALENATVVIKPVKKIQNGQLIIEKDGVQYNAQGAILK